MDQKVLEGDTNSEEPVHLASFFIHLLLTAPTSATVGCETLIGMTLPNPFGFIINKPADISTKIMEVHYPLGRKNCFIDLF